LRCYYIAKITAAQNVADTQTHITSDLVTKNFNL